MLSLEPEPGLSDRCTIMCRADMQEGDQPDLHLRGTTAALTNMPEDEASPIITSNLRQMYHHMHRMRLRGLIWTLMRSGPHRLVDTVSSGTTPQTLVMTSRSLLAQREDLKQARLHRRLVDIHQRTIARLLLLATHPQHSDLTAQMGELQTIPPAEDQRTAPAYEKS